MYAEKTRALRYILTGISSWMNKSKLYNTRFSKTVDKKLLIAFVIALQVMKVLLNSAQKTVSKICENVENIIDKE